MGENGIELYKHIVPTLISWFGYCATVMKNLCNFLEIYNYFKIEFKIFYVK
jgi:hypothetical protein